MIAVVGVAMPKKLSRNSSARSSGDEGTADDDHAKDSSKLKDKLKAAEKELKENAKAQREKDALAAAAKVTKILFNSISPVRGRQAIWEL